jgi:hypothetical protein
MDSEKAEIKVHNIKDKNKHNYLGSYQFDLQRVYNENKDHSVHNQWIGLFNYQNEKNNSVNGYLRMSLSVLHESDNKISLHPCDEKNKNKKIALPPQLKKNMTFNQLAFYFYEAFNIPDMDNLNLFKNDEEKLLMKNRECQGYVKIEYGEFTLETKVVDMFHDRIIWNQCIKIPIPEPRVSDKLFIKLYDQDKSDKDDLIGTYELNLENIIPSFADKNLDNNKFKKLKKIHFYGSDPSKKGKISELMDENSEIGIQFKGTLLLKVLKENSGPKPIKSVTDFQRDPKESMFSSNDFWFIKLRIYNYYLFNEKSIKNGEKITIYATIGEKFTHCFSVNKNKSLIIIKLIIFIFIF